MPGSRPTTPAAARPGRPVRFRLIWTAVNPPLFLLTRRQQQQTRYSKRRVGPTATAAHCSGMSDDNQAGRALHRALQATLECGGVELGEALVEHDDVSILEERAGQVEPTSLTVR